MNNDEAKAHLTLARKSVMLDDPDREALDIALWLLERERWFDSCDGAVQYARESWEREHPRPGSDSRPPMSDDGPGNTL